MKIAILDDYQNAVKKLSCFSKLGSHEVEVFTERIAAKDDLVRALREFDAIVLIRERTLISADLLSRLHNLKIISQTGRPSEHIDLSACTKNKIAVLAGSGNPVAPAELTWALIMAAQRRLPDYIDSLKLGSWQSTASASTDGRQLGRVLKGRTLGVFGLGKIGSLVSSYGRAFGMNVLVFGRAASCNRARDLGFDVAMSKQELFSRSDVLSLHIRSSQETREIVSFEDLRLMKEDSIFVNVSRAQLVQEKAIEKCLADPGAGPYLFALDVFELEPLDPQDPIIKSHRTICTPHIGFVEKDSYEMYFDTAFQNILEFEKKNFASVCNPEVLT